MLCEKPHRDNRTRSIAQSLIQEIVSTWTRTLRHLRPIALNLISHKNMNSDLTNEELSLVELQEASGGIVWWLFLGLCLIPAVAHQKIKNLDLNSQI